MSEEGRSGHKEEVFTIGRFVGGVAHTRFASSSTGSSSDPLHSLIMADLIPNGGDRSARRARLCYKYSTVQYKQYDKRAGKRCARDGGRCVFHPGVCDQAQVCVREGARVCA